MSDVNKQLLDVASELVKFQAIYEKNTREIGRMPGNDLYGPMLMRIVDCAKEAIAAAEQAQQAEPVGWRAVIPGRRYTDKWDSARVADYNDGWNDYQKAVKSALAKLEGGTE